MTNLAYYRVRAGNAVGISSVYSNVLTVDVSPLNYTLSYNDTELGISTTFVNLWWDENSSQWTPPNLPSSYQVEWLNPFGYGLNCQSVPSI
jgi:hypothetical protein